MDRTSGERVWSRRRAIAAGGAGLAAVIGAAGQGSSASARQPAALAAQQDDLARDVVAAFSQVPGRKALKLWAPADGGRSEWSATLDSGTLLFIASAFKVFVLAEYFRQAEAAL